MWKLILGGILIAGGLYSLISGGSTLMKVFAGIWTAVGLWLVYSWWSTPVYIPPPATTMFGGRRRGGRKHWY